MKIEEHSEHSNDSDQRPPTPKESRPPTATEVEIVKKTGQLRPPERLPDSDFDDYTEDLELRKRRWQKVSFGNFLTRDFDQKIKDGTINDRIDQQLENEVRELGIEYIEEEDSLTESAGSMEEKN